MRCGRDARGVTFVTHVFELFKDENRWVAEVSSDCVDYLSGHIDWKYLDQASWAGHIDWKYLDQASWIYDWMAASQSPKSVTSATMESPC